LPGLYSYVNSIDADAKEAPSLGASVYLTPFSDEAGRLWAYWKDEPYKALRASDHPKIAFERYYYSQPLDGGRDDNAIEDFFNQLAGEWPRRWTSGKPSSTMG